MRVFQVCVFLILCGVCVLCFPPSLADAVTVFSDDFSSNSIEKWQTTRVNSSSWTVDDGVLVGKVLSTSSVSELIPADEYWYEGWGDYRFSVDMMSVAGADKNIGWNYQDPRNWYEAHFVGSLVELYRLREGKTGFVSGHQFFMTPMQWHRVTVEVMGSSMKLWVDGWLVADVVDWFDDGRQGSIALKVGTGSVAPTEIHFDNVTVELLPEIESSVADVDLVMQTDQAWADREYDHASEWARQSTIGRWGCALTSLVMVLRHYGFSHFIDDVAITPESMNTWLNAQVDGYVADGWVNWLAAMRLTRQLVAQKYLEKTALSISSWQPVVGQSNITTKIAQELVEHRPVIVSLGDHFLVADGLLGNGQDIQVKDPWYPVVTLGQHIAAGRMPESLRLVVPVTSHAEVPKGWLVAIKHGTPPILTDQDGNRVDAWQPVLGPERGQGVIDAAFQSEWQVWWLPTVDVGKYHVLIKQLDGDATGLALRVDWFEYLADDSVRHTEDGVIGDVFERDLVVIDGEINWLDANGLAWNWAELAQWWFEQSIRFDSANIDAWLRLRYLFFSTAYVFGAEDDRYRQLLQLTAEYYSALHPNTAIDELIWRLPMTGSE